MNPCKTTADLTKENQGENQGNYCEKIFFIGAGGEGCVQVGFA